MIYLYSYIALCAICTAGLLTILTVDNFCRLRSGHRTLRNLARLISWGAVAKNFAFTPLILFAWVIETLDRRYRKYLR